MQVSLSYKKGSQKKRIFPEKYFIGDTNKLFLSEIYL